MALTHEAVGEGGGPNGLCGEAGRTWLTLPALALVAVLPHKTLFTLTVPQLHALGTVLCGRQKLRLNTFTSFFLLSIFFPDNIFLQYSC